MNWYYAENNERRGPLEESAFQELVAAGTIRPDTLVWREGMAAWQPWQQVSGAGTSTQAPLAAGSVPAGGGVRCSSCGNVFAESDVITIAGRTLCATCKPMAIQHMVEGTDQAGATIDPDRLLAELRSRGGYRVNVSDLLGRAWALLRLNLWPCIGTTLLAILTMGIAQQIPCIGILASFLVTGPIYGGLFLYFLKQLRGQQATVNDAFSGFNKPHFGQLALAGTVKTLIMGAIMLVFLIPAFALNFKSMESGSGDPPIAFFLALGVGMIPLAYLGIAWILSYPLIIDQRMQFWPAMELSRKVVNMNFGGWFLLMVVNCLLGIAGTLALCVGLFFVMPLTIAAIMVLYEQIITGSAEPAR